MECLICGRSLNEKTAYAVSGSADALEEVGPYLGQDPALWAWFVGPRCAKKIAPGFKVKLRGKGSAYAAHRVMNLWG